MAHPYCTTSDLKFACGGGDNDLIQVFDADGDGVADVALMAEAIENACNFIDAYINKQVLVPLADPVPPLIKQLTARVAVYHMRASKRMIDPETHGKSWTADEQTLKDIRDGVITLGVDPAPVKASARIDQVAERPWSKDRSRRNLRGFS